MPLYTIDIGAVANDGTGDPLRTAFNETNLNFDQVFTAGPVLSNVRIANNAILTLNTNGNLTLAPNGTGVVQSNVSILPNTSNLRNLGSATRRWSDLYVQYANISGNIDLAGTFSVGDLTVSGNLTVTGNTIQIGNIVTDSKTIQLSNTAGTANAANGSGITVGVNDDIATILYTNTANAWTTNIGVSAVGNVTAPYFIGNGSQLTGLPVPYGNGNVVTLLSGFGSNTITTTGNVTAGYVLGNGSQLTGITAASSYGNANVVANLAALGSNPVSTTGNVTAGYVLGNGSLLSSLAGANVTGTVANATFATSTGTATTAATVTTAAQPNITSVGILTAVSVSGNVVGGNVTTAGLITATGNIIGSNLISGGVISASGAITAPQAGSIIPFYFDNQAAFPSASTNHGAIAHSHSDGKMYFAHGGVWIEMVDVSSTQTMINKTVSGASVSVTGNVTGGNVVSGGVITATGNITGANINGNGSGLSALNFDNITSFTTAGLTTDELYLQGTTRLNVTAPNASGYIFDQYGTATLNPVLYISSGQTLAFNLDVTGHPFLIKDGAGANYSIGLSHVATTGTVLTNSAAQGQVTGTLYWKVPYGISGNYKYQCSVHGSMVANIVVTDANVSNIAVGSAATVTTATQANITSVGTLTSLSATGNITGGNLSAVNLVINNISSDDSTLVSVQDGLQVYGNITADNIGNVASLNLNGNASTVLYGNGVFSAATVSSSYGNSNVTALLDNLGSNLISSTGNMTTTANISGAYIKGNGSELTNLPTPTVTQDIASVGAMSIMLYDGTIKYNNYATVDPASGNITGGNLSATGNITGSYILGNGSQLTGLAAAYGNADVAANLAAFATNPISTSGNITANLFVGNGSLLSNITGANVTGVVANATYALNANASSFATEATFAGTANAVAGANVTGVVANATYATSAASANTANTVTDAAQANITSVGTLTNLGVSGNVTAGGLTINGTGVVTGNLQVQGNLIYNNLTNITTANLVFGLANTTTGISANGAGFVAGNTAEASFLYNYTAQEWNSNIGISAVGNVTGGHILTAGLVSATGNVTGNYVLGNGALLTGVITSVANINSGTSNVTVVSSGGNITVGVGGTANVAVFATTGAYVTGVVSASGNVTGGNLSTGGVISATGNITGGNLSGTNIAGTLTTASQTNITSVGTLGALAVTANVTGGNVLTAGIVSAAGNITGGNISATNHTGTTVSVAGNVTGGNVLTAGIISSTGNATHGNILTAGVVSAGGNITGGNVSATLLSGTTVSVTANVIGANITTAGIITATGNITGGNIITAGIMSATGNSTAGNYTTAGLITAIGNITGGNLKTAGLITATGNVNSSAGVLATGNLTGGNINTAGLITSTGNITGGNLVTAGLATVTGNITGGNVLTGGLISATGNVTTANTFVGNLVGTTVSVTGNVTAGNVIVNGQPTTYGIVNGAYLLAVNITDQSVGQNGVVNFPTTSANNGSIITKTSNSQVTLTAGNTYKLEAIVRRVVSAAGWAQFRWYDVTNSAYVGLEGFSEVVTSGATVGSTCVATHIVTPGANTTYELRQSTVNTVTVNAAYASYEITQINPTIAVQATATGTINTNYIATVRTGSIQNFTAAGDVILNATNQSAGTSVTYNTTTGFYTLTAGTTYELSFTPSWNFTGSNPYVQYDWVNATTNTALDATSGSFSTAYAYTYTYSSHNYNIISKLVYTPSTNQTVKVRVTAVAGSVTAGLASGSSAYVKAVNAAFALNALATISTTGNVSVGGNLNVTGTSTSLVRKASGVVNAGVDVTLGNLKARIPSSGNRSLQLSTVSGTYSVTGGDTYNYGGAIGGTILRSSAPRTINTTPAYMNSALNFTGDGDSDVWTIYDAANSVAWRITYIIGNGYANNMISIEQLV